MGWTVWLSSLHKPQKKEHGILILNVPCSFYHLLRLALLQSSTLRFSFLPNLPLISEKPLLTFTIDFETAKRYREANKMPHQFRRAAWTDLTVEVYL